MAKRALSIDQPAAGQLRALGNDGLPLETVALAKFLIGKILVRDGDDGRVRGRIVETEAYPPGDPAGHARSGRTARNASLFLEHGHVYVAPPDNHLTVGSDGRLALDQSPPVRFLRPSIDLFLSSLADSYDGRPIMLRLIDQSNVFPYSRQISPVTSV